MGPFISCPVVKVGQRELCRPQCTLLGIIHLLFLSTLLLNSKPIATAEETFCLVLILKRHFDITLLNELGISGQLMQLLIGCMRCRSSRTAG